MATAEEHQFYCFGFKEDGTDALEDDFVTINLVETLDEGWITTNVTRCPHIQDKKCLASGRSVPCPFHLNFQVPRDRVRQIAIEPDLSLKAELGARLLSASVVDALPPCLKNPSRDAKYLGIVNRKAKPNT